VTEGGSIAGSLAHRDRRSQQSRRRIHYFKPK
jgi:hypothetical protein